MLQELIEAEATAVIGAGPHERSEARVVQRNGHRPRTLSTKAGDLELAIPKLRSGSFFPSLLERRRRVATGVSADGRREVLGFAVGDSEEGAFWTAFLRSLKARGLHGVKLVISDAHTGLKAAIAAVMIGSSWQRCRVHFLRNVLAQVPNASQEMVAAAIRTIFAQPDAQHVRDRLDVIATMLGRQFPKVEAMLREAADDVTVFADFPPAHWKKIWSTNPLERVNKEIKRRTDVVGVFPNPAALLRLAGAVLIETHDEWQVSDRRYLSENSMAQIGAVTTDTVKEVAGPAAAPGPGDAAFRCWRCLRLGGELGWDPDHGHGVRSQAPRVPWTTRRRASTSGLVPTTADLDDYRQETECDSCVEVGCVADSHGSARCPKVGRTPPTSTVDLCMGALVPIRLYVVLA